MEVINYFKNIFSKSNLSANISLFSILGIMAILFSNIADLYTSETYFGYPPTRYWELVLDIIVVLLLSILFKGYVYDYAHKLYQDECAQLPDVNIKSFITFFKMLPLFVTWYTYTILLAILGTHIFSMFNFWAYCYYGLIICLTPFISVVFAIYAKDFNFAHTVFNPVPLFKVLRYGFKDVLVFLLELIPFLAIVYIVFDKSFSYTKSLANYPSVQLAIRLALLSVSAYISGVFSLVYVQGFVKIIRKNNIE